MLNIEVRASQIASALGIEFAAPDFVLHHLCGPEERADFPLYFLGPRKAALLHEVLALPGSLVVVEKGVYADEQPIPSNLIQVPSSRLALCLCLEFIEEQKLHRHPDFRPGISSDAKIHPLAFVDCGARIDAGADIGPFAYVGPGVHVGSETRLLPGARITRNVSIGRRCLIRENCVIGGNGFGIEKDADGNNRRLPHLGGVVIANHVEIGALTTVCAGTIKPTAIGDHTKIDDHCHVGHNVVIADNAIITAGSILGGSSSYGPHAWIGINSTIKQGLSIGARSVVGMAACITKNVAEAETVAGNPGRPLAEFAAVQRHLQAAIKTPS